MWSQIFRYTNQFHYIQKQAMIPIFPIVTLKFSYFWLVDYYFIRPQPRLINFFEAICTVGGVAVKANQEMILRLTWMNEEARNSAYLVTREYTAEEMTPVLPELPKVKLPTGKLTDGKILGNIPQVNSTSFLFTSSSTLIYVIVDIFVLLNIGNLAPGLHRQRSAWAFLESLATSVRALVVEWQLDSW